MTATNTNLPRLSWTYYGCDKEDEERLAACWQERAGAVSARAAELSDAVSHLNIAAERSETSPQWVLHAALHVPGLTLVADGAGETAEESIDDLLSHLAAAIDREQDEPIEVTQRRRGVEAFETVLASWREKGASEAFMSFLLPLAVSTGPYIHRELQVREIRGARAAAQLSPLDMLNEMLLLAWERFPQRTAAQPLDVWLMQLADEVMERLITSTAEVSTDEEVPAPSSEPRPTLEDEWIEQVSYLERVELSQLLPGERGIDAWDETQMELVQRHLAELLGDVPREQRHALVLNAALGYSAAEIADFQDRSTEDVEADIAEAITEIRRRLQTEGSIDLAEAFEKEELHAERKRRGAQR